MSTFKEYISLLNRTRKKNYPSAYVSRKKYLNLLSKYDTLADAITSINNPFLKKVKTKGLVDYSPKLHAKELCLFVTYAASPLIKPHVEHHIKALLNEKIDVILIINTNNIDASIEIPDSIKKLSGIYLRENIGFDFGAWSQAYGLIDNMATIERIYLINDSIIGPLSEDFFDSMLKKIRSSDADIIGLTANNEPKFHIQSFFLVFNNKIINDNNFKKFMSSLWQFPTKEIVIDFYEIRLTQLLSNLGYKTETIYPTDDLIFDKSNAVVYSLKALLARGFPYIKTSVSTLPSGKEILEKFLPSEAYKASKNNTKIL